MARGTATVQRVGFNAGLITEANPVTQPPNSMQDASNAELLRNGDIRRRFGIGTEANGTAISTGVLNNTGTGSSIAVQEYSWDNPGGDNAKEFSVVQIGNKLYFFDVSTAAPSSNLANSGQPLVLDSTKLAFGILGFSPISFSSISGNLVMTSMEMDTPYYIWYSKTTDVFTVGRIELEVRDTWGVEDELHVTEKPTSLTDSHLYNLYNQGWDELDSTQTNYQDLDVTNDTGGTVKKIPVPTSNYGAVTVTAQPVNAIGQVFTDRGTYPSNTEIQNLYSSDLDELVRTNSTPAPKGRFVIKAFNRGAARTEVTDLLAGDGVGLVGDSDSGNVSLVKSFANRIFYSGAVSVLSDGDTRSPVYSSTVFFTQIVTAEQDLGKCYQNADPTSEDLSELLANDGGFINITEANNIIGMETLSGSLLVFADNGVWAITGPDRNFRADDYSVIKVTDTGALGADSIVATRDSIMFWSAEGVFSIELSDVGFNVKAGSMIETTIQTFYNDIPSAGKLYAKGVFDRLEQRVRWMYNDVSGYPGADNRYLYNRELVFDLVLNAWYHFDFIEERLRGYVQTSPYSVLTNTETVVDESDTEVVDALGDTVVFQTTSRGSNLSRTKYLTSNPKNKVEVTLTLSELNNTDFLDFLNTDAAAFVLTSWENNGDLTRRKDINYLHMFFKRTETAVDALGDPLNASSCLVRARWDFSDSISAGKWSVFRQAYRYRRLFTVTGDGSIDYGQEVLVTKNKVRGSGRVLALEFTSEPGKDFVLHGWAMSLLGNQAD